MIDRLCAITNERLDLGVALRGKVMVEQAGRIGVPRRIHHVGERWLVENGAEKASATDENLHVVPGGKVSKKWV